MQRTATIATSVFLLLLATPVQASETTSESYVAGVSFSVLGTSFAAYCDDACIGDDTGLGDLPNIGGATLSTPSGASYANVIVSIEDMVSAGVGGTACVFSPDGDNICNDEDYSTEWGCGTFALMGSPFPTNAVNFWIVGILVTDALDVCGPATAGTITATFY